jgi:TRAP-type C4-dicarboxylate transport system substrate-binding protein
VPDRRHLTVAVLAVVAGGCAVRGPIGDKAGGVPGGKVVLRLAVVSSQLRERPPVQYFISRVKELSGGNVTITVRYNWKSPDPTAEQQVVKATAAGVVDLGVVGSRVFDTMGVRTLQALTAPMLIDSYPLENAVLHNRVATQMLAGVARLHVVGLALVGNGLRKPVAVARPLLRRRDWRGITFGTYLSEVQEETIRALRATPLVAFSALRNHFLAAGQLEGFEFNDLSYYINNYWDQAHYITANVILWPQIDVLVASPHAMAQLTSQQQDWLQQAAREAADTSARTMAADEASVVATICEHGTRFAQATRGDLLSLHLAVAPVSARLERNRQTASFIARIEAIKRATPAGSPLPAPKDCVRK